MGRKKRRRARREEQRVFMDAVRREVAEHKASMKMERALTPLELEFPRGSRVKIHPATDAFMRGIRYGEVHSIEGSVVVINPDNIPDSIGVGLIRFHPEKLELIT